MSKLQEYLANPNVQAFLRVIREGESSQDDRAYTTMYGGGQFSSFAKHPNQLNKAGKWTSTAAGAYQFLNTTWNGLVKQYGFSDFSPANQDLGAVALIIGRRAINDVVNGHFDSAIAKIGKEWASMPGSPYGQPVITLERARSVYEAYGGVYGPAQSTDATEAIVEASKPVEQPTVITERPKMVPLPIITLAIQALSAFMPKIRELFPGSEVAERNMKAAEAVVNIAKDAIGAANEQDLIEKVKESPEAAKTVSDAIQENWFSIVEVGGGIVEARKAAVEMTKAESPFWKNPAFILSILLLIPVYAVIGSVIGLYGVQWDENVKMLVVGIISNVVSGTMGFWLGSSFGSQKKSDPFVK